MKILATGVMSGTSLDGIDVAYCAFWKDSDHWSYEILFAETITYPEPWQKRLQSADQLPANDFVALHADYGHYIANVLKEFFNRNQIDDPGVIASHGHTVFHRPDQGYTFQLGHGAAIAAGLSANVICDFRSLDIALQGQGAPLVPTGDMLLFGQYDHCLNLGGFANISSKESEKCLAYDICPLNFIINRLVQSEKILDPGDQNGSAAGILLYDRDGNLARQGHVCAPLLEELNQLAYYKINGPKSLGAEWVNHHIWPLLDPYSIGFHDKLRTFYEHAAEQIQACIPTRKGTTVLASGGGCHNHFFVGLLRKKLPEQVSLIIPDSTTINYKEALAFALLGVLWKLDLPNCLSSATGSIRNSIGGCMYKGTA